ncbi:MAG TPA: response regulator [Methanoregulaceae archaeon]|nr:response regulator [Methanoregulaceae archaeon]HOV67640.1 response regulator [Methanoregulaceae archaeon]HQJ87461.1 response regulator [Methanoregulaceae archaeon]
MTTRVLYVEDNDQNYYLVKFILEAQGYEVVRARDGREGIELARTVDPALILLDIQLPVMDGYETARELRTIPGLAPVPVVALTSYAMAGDREKALAAGCTGYIEKPIDPTTFSGEIAAHLARSRSGGGSG